MNSQPVISTSANENVQAQESKRSSIDKGFATIDQVVAPYLNAIKKSTHDVIVAKKSRQIAPAEAKLKAELLLENLRSEPTESLATTLKHNSLITDTIKDSVNKLISFTNSQYGFVYLVHPEYNAIYLCPSFIYSDLHEIRFEIKEGASLAQFVAFSKEVIVTDDVLEDSRFPLGLGQFGIHMTAAMGIPIMTHLGQLVGVIELGRDKPFTEVEVTSAVLTAQWMGSSLGISADKEALIKRETFFEYALHMTCYYSSTRLLPVETVITYFMTFAKDYLNAGHARLLVVSDRSDREQLFDSYEETINKNTGQVIYTKLFSIGVNDIKSVANEAMRKNEILNLKEDQVIEYEKWRLDEDYFSVLCAPIGNSDGKVLGLIELLNKLGGIRFTEEDEVAVKRLASFGYIVLSHYKLMLKKKSLTSGVGLYSEMFCRHMQPCSKDMELLNKEFTAPTNLWSYKFVPEREDEVGLNSLAKHLMIQILGTDYPASPSVATPVLSAHSQQEDCCTKNVLIDDDEQQITVDFIIACIAKAHSITQTSEHGQTFASFWYDLIVAHSVAVIINSHHQVFTHSEKEEMILAAMMHKINVKCQNGRFASKRSPFNYNDHFIKIMLRAFNVFNTVKYRRVVRLAKACNAKTSRPYQLPLIRLILTDKFSWEDQAHRFKVMALVMRLCEKSIWFKPFYYSAYYSRQLLSHVNKLNEDQNEPAMKKSEFLAKIIQEISEDCLPDIHILSKLLAGFDSDEQLRQHCRDALHHWKVISNHGKSQVWQATLSMEEEKSRRNSTDGSERELDLRYRLDLIEAFTDKLDQEDASSSAGKRSPRKVCHDVHQTCT